MNTFVVDFMANIILPYTNQKGEQEQESLGFLSKSCWILSAEMTSIDLTPLQESNVLEELKFTTLNLETLDLNPLAKCHKLRKLLIKSAGKLIDLNLSPLSECSSLEVLEISGTAISNLDITPLFQCINLRAAKISRKISLIADKKLKKNKVRGLDKLSKRIRWYGEADDVDAIEPEVDDLLRKKVLGVLKSFPRITISELTQYSRISSENTRNLVFQLVGEGLVEGRFDSSADAFVSTDAALASKKAKSDGLSVQSCAYCGKPLERVLNPGEEVPCPACNIINIG